MNGPNLAKPPKHTECSEWTSLTGKLANMYYLRTDNWDSHVNVINCIEYTLSCPKDVFVCQRHVKLQTELRDKSNNIVVKWWGQLGRTRNWHKKINYTFSCAFIWSSFLPYASVRTLIKDASPIPSSTPSWAGAIRFADRLTTANKSLGVVAMTVRNTLQSMFVIASLPDSFDITAQIEKPDENETLFKQYPGMLWSLSKHWMTKISSITQLFDKYLHLDQLLRKSKSIESSICNPQRQQTSKGTILRSATTMPPPETHFLITGLRV